MIVAHRGKDELVLWEAEIVKVKKHSGDDERFFVRGSLKDATEFELYPSGNEIVDILGNDGKRLVTVTEKLAKWRMQ